MSTKQDVSYGQAPSPQQLLLQGPDLIIQQQQLQRKQALIDALRAQSLEQIDGGRGRISWTQGLAKLANAWVASSMQKKNDKAAAGIYQGMGARQNAMFGIGANGPGATQMQPQQAMPQQPQPMPAPPTQTITPVDPDVALNAPMATPQPQQAPQQQAPQQPPMQPQQGYPMSLSGNSQQDAFDYASNPEEYTKAMITSHAPVAPAQMMRQAQAALARGDMAGAQAILGQLSKDQYIAPINGRPGSTIRDPRDPSRILGYDAPTVEGAFPTYGPNGMPTGYQSAPGAQQAMAGMAGAKAGAIAAAQSPYDVVEVYNPQTGQYQKVPKSAITGGMGPNGQIVPSGPMVSNPGPSAQSAGAASGTNSANQFNEAISSGQAAKDSIRQIDLIQTAAQGLSTGRGAGAVSDAKSAWNVIAPDALKFNQENVAKFDEMKKNASALGLSLAGAASGSNGTTDARLNTALSALPGANYSPAAIQEVSYNLKGLQSGAYGRSQAAAKWQQSHGPESYPQFQSTWQQAYNPDIFYYRQKGTKAFGDWYGRLPKDHQGQVRQQMNTLAQLGAFE